MRNIRWILLSVVFCLVFGIAFAESYQATINAYPSGAISSSDDIVVFGSIDLLDSDTSIYSSRLKIEIQDASGSLVNTHFPDFVAKSGDATYLYDGFFFKKIGISSGSYLLKLKINDDPKAIKTIDVSTLGTRITKLKILDYSIYQDRVKVVLSINNTDNSTHNYNVQLISDELSSPLSFNVEVVNRTTVQVEKDFALSQFGDGNFIIVAQARESSGSDTLSSNADYVIVYNSENDTTTYAGRSLTITSVELPAQLYSGEVAEGFVHVKNTGTSEAVYRFEYILNNSIYRRGDVSYVQPGHTNDERFFLDIPEGNTMMLTVRLVTTGSPIEKTNNYLISARTRQFSLSLNDYSEIVFAGNKTSFNATVANTGNLEDTYNIKIFSWYDNKIDKETLTLTPIRTSSFQITLNTAQDMIIGDYPVIINVCNSEGYCLNKTFMLKLTKLEKDQNEITWDENQTNKTFTANSTLSYNITVKNIGITDKDYLIYLEPALAQKISFTLTPYETRNVQFSLTPINNTDQKVRMLLSAENTTIFATELNLIYKNESSGFFTGMFIYHGELYKPGLYILAIIGVIVPICFVYMMLRKRAWTERILDYNERMQRQLY